MKIVITGAGGLIGWHAAVRIHAANCSARSTRSSGQPEPYQLVCLDRTKFQNDSWLHTAVSGADAILHFAGVNRATNTDIEIDNSEIAERLVEACIKEGVKPHIVYANSIHATSDTPYGRSKRIAGEILARVGGKYTDLVLPHIFGECARPRYNNVTATFIEAVIKGMEPDVNPDGYVELLHAGSAAQLALDAVQARQSGVIMPEARRISVVKLLAMLQKFHTDYSNNIYPDLQDPFTVQLFNSYRVALYPVGFPRSLMLYSDTRGSLFEVVKGGGGGQTFMSTTKPGITRGNHFHLKKVERFLVVQGEALIRIRKVLTDQVWEYHASGDRPAFVDMPTLHTHSIENIGSKPLLTVFWTHELFNPGAPDTYADPVLQQP